MEREIDYLLSVYTLEEIFAMCDLDEKEILLYLVDEGILVIDTEIMVKLSDI